MFVQFIRGRVRDPEGVKRQIERWARELEPGAAGFVGSTVGITPGGELVALARFESAEAARANSARPEQDAWWKDFVACLDGEPVVKETENVGPVFDRGCDAARFVQVMEGTGDEAALRAVDEKLMEAAAEVRPDVLGGYRAFFADGSFVEVAYFTNEADARAGEAKEMPPEVAALFDELGRLAPDMVFHDLPEPWLT